MVRKIMNLRLTAFCALFILLCGLKCTENPFYKNPGEVRTQRTVSGQVVLNDQSMPDSVFIWLDEFDIGTYTEANGNFSLRLPAPETQAGGGIDGIFNLYFYLVNFKIDSATLAVKNGEFIYGSADMNDAGKLKNTVVLQKLLNIELIISPDTITTCYTEFIRVNLRLRALSSAVRIYTLMNSQGNMSGILLKRTDIDEQFYRIFKLPGTQLDHEIISTTLRESSVNYVYEYCSLPNGDYLIVPFLWEEQPGIPEGLLRHLGVPLYQFSIDYLKFPMKRSGGKFRINASPGRASGGTVS